MIKQLVAPLVWAFDYWRLGRLLRARERVNARWDAFVARNDDRLDVFPDEEWD